MYVCMQDGITVRKWNWPTDGLSMSVPVSVQVQYYTSMHKIKIYIHSYTKKQFITHLEERMMQNIYAQQ